MGSDCKYNERMELMNLKKTIMYLLEWLLPSSTAVYIIASTNFTWGTYLFWGYPMNLPAYIIACIAGALIFFPVNKYIFKNKCDAVEIKINGNIFRVNNHDEFMVDEDMTVEFIMRKEHG